MDLWAGLLMVYGGARNRVGKQTPGGGGGVVDTVNAEPAPIPLCPRTALVLLPFCGGRCGNLFW